MALMLLIRVVTALSSAELPPMVGAVAGKSQLAAKGGSDRCAAPRAVLA